MITKKRIKVAIAGVSSLFAAFILVTELLAVDAAVVTTLSHSQTERWQNFRNHATNCQQLQVEGSCQYLLTEGVAPSLYITDKTYRNQIDIEVNKRLEGSIKDTKTFAELTLTFGTDPRAQLAVDVIKQLELLQEKDQQSSDKED